MSSKNEKIRGISIIIILMVILGVNLYSIQPRRNPLSPSGIRYSTFTDQVENDGLSKVVDTACVNNGFLMRFHLNQGFISPYVGMNLTPLKRDYFNLDDCDYLSVNIIAENFQSLQLVVTTYQSGITNKRDPFSYRHNVLNIPLDKSKHHYELDLDNLSSAQWWLEKNKLSSSELGNADLRRTKSISLIAKVSVNDYKNQVLQAGNFFLLEDLSSFFYVSIPLMLLLIWITTPNIDKKRIVKYEPVEDLTISSDNLDPIYYVARNFSDPSLSLNTVSWNTGIPEAEVSRIIFERYNVNFRKFLNGIRISEAKRLLMESQLNISEIAYKVGYNSPNHFNRVFKENLNTSPTLYRQNALKTTKY